MSIEQLWRLDTWLHKRIRVVEASERTSRSKEVTKERSVGHVTYRLEGIRCGKEKCKCVAGELHGPYWYAYWLEGGKTRSKYIGKRLTERRARKVVKAQR